METPQQKSRLTLVVESKPTRTHQLNVLLTPEEAKEMQDDANSQGMSMSAFVRALWRTWREYKTEQQGAK